MPNGWLAPVLAAALALPLAGCSDGEIQPRLLVGDGPPADEWGLIESDGGEPARPKPTTAPVTRQPQPSEAPDPPEDDEGDDDGGSGEDDGASRGPLLVLQPGDEPGSFVVASHADGANWGDVAVAADAGSWTLLLDGGAEGRYDFGEGLLASPEPGRVRDGDEVRFCDRSSVDGVTASYVEVQDVAAGQVLLRERIQGTPC